MPILSLKVNGKSVIVENLIQASKLVQESFKGEITRDEWYAYPCNGYMYSGKKFIARISPNGRAWDSDELNAKEVFTV